MVLDWIGYDIENKDLNVFRIPANILLLINNNE